MKSTVFGFLYPAILPLQKFTMSFSNPGKPDRAFVQDTIALMASPHLAIGDADDGHILQRRMTRRPHSRSRKGIDYTTRRR